MPHWCLFTLANPMTRWALRAPIIPPRPAQAQSLGADATPVPIAREGAHATKSQSEISAVSRARLEFQASLLGSYGACFDVTAKMGLLPRGKGDKQAPCMEHGEA